MEKILSKAEVRGVLGVSNSTLWRLSRDGLLPRPFAVSPGKKGWRASTIEAYVQRREKLTSSGSLCVEGGE